MNGGNYRISQLSLPLQIWFRWLRRLSFTLYGQCDNEPDGKLIKVQSF